MLKEYVLNNLNIHKSNNKILTIGDFDGCHLGHQKLISTAIKISNENNILSSALSFDPSPKDFFNINPHTKHLFSTVQKIRAFRELGLDNCFIQTFDHNFSQKTAIDFIESTLLKKIYAKGIVIGNNFRFGKNREGGPDLLRHYFLNNLQTLELVSQNLETSISSSLIRKYLVEGQIKQANLLLGRPYSIEGKVAKGNQIGRTIQIPTANFSEVDQLLPKNGVYCGFIACWSSNQSPPSLISVDYTNLIPAVMNIGTKPTISESTELVQVEAHLLLNNSQMNLYDHNLSFYFIERIRDEMKFPSLLDLKQQIANDIDKSKSILNACIA